MVCVLSFLCEKVFVLAHKVCYGFVFCPFCDIVFVLAHKVCDGFVF